MTWRDAACTDEKNLLVALREMPDWVTNNTKPNTIWMNAFPMSSISLKI
ncbi:hypothetical protein [uncultured Draconibacterium sp.]